MASTEYHVLRVTMTDADTLGVRPSQIWLAAVPRAQAIEAVRQTVPARWVVEWMQSPLDPDVRDRIVLQPGEVCELSHALGPHP